MAVVHSKEAHCLFRVGVFSKVQHGIVRILHRDAPALHVRHTVEELRIAVDGGALSRSASLHPECAVDDAVDHAPYR